MKNTKLLILAIIATVTLSSCGPDDDAATIAIRDADEVYAEDLEELNTFLATHFYNYEDFQANTSGDLEVLLDTIDGVNASKIPLSQQVEEKTLTRGGIDYKYYILRVRQGEGTVRATHADSSLVSYKGFLTTDRTLFDQAITPVWFDLPQAIDGFKFGIAEFNDAASTSLGSDGILSFQGSGVGAVFFPSGIGYFNFAQPGIPPYSPLVFTFQVRKSKLNDPDQDGILSIYEDIDGDRNLRTSGGDNTDSDTFFNYLDADDDGDGILTINENPDPNGDGNPDDALDTDGDGIPDYLDNNTQV